jgi:hypothetical protein
MHVVGEVYGVTRHGTKESCGRIEIKQRKALELIAFHIMTAFISLITCIWCGMEMIFSTSCAFWEERVSSAAKMAEISIIHKVI